MAGLTQRLFMTQIAKRGIRGAGGLAKRGILGGASKVKSAIGMQQARRRQAERGLSAVGMEEFESKNYEMIAEKERVRLRAKMNAEYNSIKKVHKVDLDVIQKNIKRVISERKLRISLSPVVMDLLSINLLKKVTELRKAGELPKGPLAQKAMDDYIANTIMKLRQKLSFVGKRNPSALSMEINSEIANTLNEVAEGQI